MTSKEPAISAVAVPVETADGRFEASIYVYKPDSAPGAVPIPSNGRLLRAPHNGRLAGTGLKQPQCLFQAIGNATRDRLAALRQRPAARRYHGRSGPCRGSGIGDFAGPGYRERR